MKKSGIVITVLLILLVLIGIYAAVRVVNSPEYALSQILKDVKAEGLDGLTPHLTESALETVERLNSFTDNKAVGWVLSLLGKEDYLDTLKADLSKVDWQLDDILKNSKKANVYLDFNYEDQLKGKLNIGMLKENREWKINSLSWPEFSDETQE